MSCLSNLVSTAQNMSYLVILSLKSGYWDRLLSPQTFNVAMEKSLLCSFL